MFDIRFVKKCVSWKILYCFIALYIINTKENIEKDFEFLIILN